MQSKPLFVALSCFGCAGLICAPTKTVCADPFLPVPPASFLNYHVGNAEQLAEEVSLDAVVRKRLANHFHQTEPNVTRYIHDNLVLTHLSKAGQYRVACVTPSGREYFLSQHLAAGTGVFALKSTGQPILKQACGNPLVAVLPAVAKKKIAAAQLASLPHAVAPVPEVSAAMPSDVVFTSTPTLAAAPLGAAGPFVKVAGITQSLGHSGGGGGFFPAVLGIAGVGLFASHHGSTSTSTTHGTPLIPATPSIPNVPVTPSTPIVPVTPPNGTPPISTPPTNTPPVSTPPLNTPPVETPPVLTPPVEMSPVLTPPTVTPPFIGPPPTTPPSQSAVPEPGPVVIFGLGGLTLAVLRLRARRRI